MGRRKGIQNKVSRDVKRKSKKKTINHNSVDRNRASPHPVKELCKTGLTDDQRAAVVSMGQGNLLDIGCNDLHNPMISWFARCYDPGRRAFVLPCRGVIPLSEESVHLMTGFPRGPLEVKYLVDFELENKILSRLFPGQGSRPKVSYVAKRISQYKAADDTFKELWMIHSVSTIFAPTLDNKISNRCYPMLTDIGQAAEMNICKFVADQLHENFSSGKFGRGCLLYCMLRHITAINTDAFDLNLKDTPFPINSWTSDSRDAVAALDTQEYDATKFGVMQLRDEFKDVLSREMGLFGGPDGFESWMKLNLHPTSTNEQKRRAHSLMLSFASTVNGALSNLIQGLTEAVPCEKCGEADANKGLDSEIEGDDRIHGNDESDGEADINSSASKEDEETETDLISKQDTELSHRGGNEVVNPVVNSTSNIPDGQTESITAAGASSIRSPPNQAAASSSGSPPPIHSQICVPSDSELFGSDGGGYIGGFIVESPHLASQLVDDQIRGSAAHLISKLSKSNTKTTEPSESELKIHNDIKVIIAKELQIPIKDLPDAKNGEDVIQGGVLDNRDAVHLQFKSVEEDISRNVLDSSLHLGGHDQRHVVEGTILQGEAADRTGVSVEKQGSGSGDVVDDVRGPAIVSNALIYNPLHKRKRRLSPRISPSRKSPSLGQLHSGRNIVSPPSATQGNLKNYGKGSGKSSLAAQADGRSTRTAFVVSPTVSNTAKVSGEITNKKHGDGSAKRKSAVSEDGSSASTAFVVSPTVSNTPKSGKSASKLKEIKDGKKISSAIAISPTVADSNVAEHRPEDNSCRDIVLSPICQQSTARGSGSSASPYTVSPIFGKRLLSLGSVRPSLPSVSPHLASLVKALSDTVNKQGVLSTGCAQKRKHVHSGSSYSKKKRDDRPGMFTPPPFDLCGSSQENPSQDEPINAMPISWAQSEDGNKGIPRDATDEEFEEFVMSEELKNFILGNIVQLSPEGTEELHRYEDLNKAFSKRQRVLQINAKPGGSKGVRSLTPKAQPHKPRVKKLSRFKQSPYNIIFSVNKDQEDVYKLILLSSSHHRDDKSKLKSYRIIVYKNSWAYTMDLADSIHARGELSNHCMDVGIEYLQNTNTIKDKLIMTHQLTKYVMDQDFLKPMVIATFKRTEVHSLSVMKQLHFPVFHEIAKGEKFGNHWYSLCLNIETQRFEALDSLRGEGNSGLIGHATALVNRIKELWATYYADSKIQIQHYDLKIIDVPKQHGIHDCGFHTLFNIEHWDGENIPQIGKDDVMKLRKLFPYKWASAQFNLAKDWRWHLDNNM